MMTIQELEAERCEYFRRRAHEEFKRALGMEEEDDIQKATEDDEG